MVDSFSRSRTPREGGFLVADTILVALAVLAFPILVDGAGAVSFGNGRLIDANASDAFAVSAADLDGDGDIDVVAALTENDEVFWYENVDGIGTFAERAEISPCCERARPTSVAIGDLNGDGFPDVVVGFAETNQVTWFRNSDGLGDFAVGSDVATNAELARKVIVADLDGDGDLDIVSASWRDDSVTWYENTDETGTFAAGLEISTTTESGISMVAADLDSDGDLDVLVASYYDNRVTWFNNSDGNGAFSLGVNITLEADGPAYVAAADLDGDLDIDVISASADDGRVIWYENTDGRGTFANGIDIDVLASASSVAAADLDNDGDIDLVVAESEDGRIVWYENMDGLATFSTANDIAEDPGVKEVIVADIDGDGDFDLVAASRDEGRVVWYENLSITTTNTTSDADDPAQTPAPAGVAEPLLTPAPVVATPRVTLAPAAEPLLVTPAPVLDTPREVFVDDESSDNRWLDAAWEIAVTVTGGVLVAVLVAFILKWNSRDVREDLVGVSIPRQSQPSFPVDDSDQT